MREKSFDSINVVPFIDIMLVLLTIVLATATFIQTGAIPVSLPETSYSVQQVEGVVITISKDSKMYINNKESSINDIETALKNHDPKATFITIWADKKAEIQPLAELMSFLKEHKFEKVSLQIEVKK